MRLLGSLLVTLALLQQVAASAVIRPRLLQLYVGGYAGCNYEVVYDGHALRYYKAEDSSAFREADPAVIEVSPEAWAELYDSLNRIDPWQWKSKYMDPDVADGFVWSCAIVYDTQQDRTVVAFGSNAGPEELAGLIRVMGNLVGDPRFGEPLPRELMEPSGSPDSHDSPTDADGGSTPVDWQPPPPAPTTRTTTSTP